MMIRSQVTSLRRLLVLPIEIRQCILYHLPSLSLPPSRSRFQSTVSLVSSSSSLSLSSSTNLSLSSSNDSIIFESPSSPEYTHVPPSTLDYPSPPRSPSDSLLTLLRNKDYSSALSLLQELESTNIRIDKKYSFGKYSLKCLNEFGWEDKSWLKWWELCPSLVGEASVRDDVGINLRKVDNEMFGRASKIVRVLKRCLEEEGISSSSEEGAQEKRKELVEKIKVFGEVLSKQGYSRVVAEGLVEEVAMEDLGMGEKLWQVSLRELREQRDLMRVSEKLRVEEAKLGDEERRERLNEQTRIIEDWYASRSWEAYKVVVRSRERIIRSLANAGRVDQAVRLILETNNYPSLYSSTSPVQLSKSLYLTILAQLSNQNRFDLLRQVYARFEEQENKLVRIRNKELRSRTPYWARGSMYNEGGKERSPSAQEAFTTFRDQHKVSSIEEGSLDDLDEYSVATAKGDDTIHYGMTTSERESEKLVKLVDEGKVDQALVKITKLLSHGPLPSAQSVATFIHSLSTHENGQEVLETIDQHVKNSNWRRGFWATCRMLEELHKGELRVVVRRFRDYFFTNNLPPPLPASIAITSSKVPSTRSHSEEDDSPRFKRSVPNAYTLSIFMQALVPLLSSDPLRTSGGTRHISNIYQTLLLSSSSSSSPSRFRIVPTHKPFSGRVNLRTKKSPLDPYTFLPFMLVVLKRRNRGKLEQEELVGILRDMQRLGLRPQEPHVALLLSSYARSGDLEEFNWILSSLLLSTSPPSVSTRPPSISTELVEFINTHLATTGKEEESKKNKKLSPKLFATLLKSLRLRGAKEEGMELLKGLMERVGVDGLRGMLETKEGEGLRDEVGRLR